MLNNNHNSLGGEEHVVGVHHEHHGVVAPGPQRGVGEGAELDAEAPVPERDGRCS